VVINMNVKGWPFHPLGETIEPNGPPGDGDKGGVPL